MSRAVAGEVLDRAESLRLLPAAALRIREVADDPAASMADLERAVSFDPALSAAVLRLANSAFYGVARAVGSLRQAVLVLGFRATRDLALALALLSIGRTTHPARAEITRHAMRVAAGARALAAACGASERASEAFVAGLLHDIGHIVLLELHGTPPSSGDEAAAPHRLAVEREVYGVDHAALGGACLERWGLPGPICDAARDAHAWAEPGLPLLTAIVGIADHLDDTVRAGAPAAAAVEEVAAAAARVGLSLPALHAALREMGGCFR